MTDKNELQELLSIYETHIQPYEFVYELQFGIKISLVIRPDEVCHLIFGTVKNKNIPNSSFYKGELGYRKIKAGDIKKAPPQLSKEYKSKSKAFKNLHLLLEKPQAIMFNKNLVKKVICGTTDIDADFLFFKEVNGASAHLFLKLINNKREKRYVAKSCLHNIDDNYKKNQIALKVISVEKNKLTVTC